MKRKCLIIGANGGIGHAIMKKLLQERYEIIGTYHKSKEHVELFQSNEKVKLYHLDLNNFDKEEISKLDLRGITDVIFASGKESVKNILNCNENEMFEQYNINVFSPLLLVQFILQKYGEKLRNIIFISSSAAFELKSSNGVYALSKACLCNLVKMLDCELRTKGIRVNCVTPGWCETEMTERVAKAKGSSINAIKNNKLDNRLVQVEELAEICLFLLSDLAINIHGQFIGIDVPEKEL